jgi:hypothetical protein
MLEIIINGKKNTHDIFCPIHMSLFTLGKKKYTPFIP